MNNKSALIELINTNPVRMEELVHCFRPMILKLARQLVYIEYEDAIQEMTLAFIQIIHKINPKDFGNTEDADKYLIGYIQKAMQSRFLNLCKTSKLRYINKTDGTVFPETEDPSLPVEQKVEVHIMMELLTPLQRCILIQKYLYGYSDTELAQKQCISRQAVNGTKKRALKILQQCYL